LALASSSLCFVLRGFVCRFNLNLVLFSLFGRLPGPPLTLRGFVVGNAVGVLGVWSIHGGVLLFLVFWWCSFSFFFPTLTTWVSLLIPRLYISMDMDVGCFYFTL
jgi:hypothetical protein